MTEIAHRWTPSSIQKDACWNPKDWCSNGLNSKLCPNNLCSVDSSVNKPAECDFKKDECIRTEWKEDTNSVRPKSNQATKEKLAATKEKPAAAEGKLAATEGKPATISYRVEIQDLKDYYRENESKILKDKVHKALTEWFSLLCKQRKNNLDLLITKSYFLYNIGLKDTDSCFNLLYLLEDNKDTLETIEILAEYTGQHTGQHGNKQEIAKEHLPSQFIKTKKVKSTPSKKGSASLEKSAPKPKKQEVRTKEEFLCKVCLSEVVAVTFVPCGHLVSCVSCSAALTDCPICRASILGTLRTYL